MDIFLADETATLALGEALGRALAAQSGAISLHLLGNLGAGKTTLTRGILRAFGHAGAVKSPTYTLVEVYELGGRPLYHFDLYRLGDPEELEYMGIRDYFAGGAICLIEWPERGEGVLRQPGLTIALAPHAEGRMVGIAAHDRAGEAVLARLQQDPELPAPQADKPV